MTLVEELRPKTEVFYDADSTDEKDSEGGDLNE